MSWPLTFWVDAAPVGKGRPRYKAPRDGARKIAGVKVVGGRVALVERAVGVTVVTPSRTVNAEKVVWATAVGARNNAGLRAIAAGVPVFVDIEAGIKIPESWTLKAKDEATSGVKLPTGVPDLDNIVKLVMDAINKTLFFDDRQVAQITAKKVYVTTPYVRVTVGPIQPKGET